MMDVVLVTTSSFGKCSPRLIEQLSRRGFRVIDNRYGRKISEKELSSLLHEHKPVGVLAGTEPISGKILSDAKLFLRVISRVGVGWDNVDRKAAAELGILVYRTEGVLNQSVAELTVGFILAALRNITLQNSEIRTGRWQKHMGGLLSGKVVGVIGFGGIGQAVGNLVNAFGAKVIFADLYPKEDVCAECVRMEELLEQADIITIHLDGSECILGTKEFEKCKDGVIVVNTARGGLVDERVLLSTLGSGKVACACLDVFEKEPYDGPLAELENVIMTPHIGSYAKEARAEMEEMAVKNLLRGLETCGAGSVLF